MSGSRLVGAVSLLVAAVMVLVPPYSGHNPELGQTRYVGFAPLWDPPTPSQYEFTMQALSLQAGVPYSLPRYWVDVTRLALQLFALGLVVGRKLIPRQARLQVMGQMQIVVEEHQRQRQR